MYNEIQEHNNASTNQIKKHYSASTLKRLSFDK